MPFRIVWKSFHFVLHQEIWPCAISISAMVIETMRQYLLHHYCLITAEWTCDFCNKLIPYLYMCHNPRFFIASLGPEFLPLK